MITKIKWKNHNILGDLELDFTKNGKPCNTIVIAGENGTEKQLFWKCSIISYIGMTLHTLIMLNMRLDLINLNFGRQ